VRTVGTKLTVEASQAKKELRDTKSEAKDLVGELQDAARNGDLTAQAIAEIGPSAEKSFGVSERAAEKLNNEIAETAREIKRLDRAFRDTGDVTLFGDLNRQLVKLKGQLKAKELFDRDFGETVGEQLAEGAGASLMTRLGPVMAKLPMPSGAAGAVGAAIGAPIAASVASIVGSAVAGAVLGGAGVGGVVGGFTLAARDARVKEALAGLGTEAMAVLGDSAKQFVPIAIQTVGVLRKELRAVKPELDEIFADSADLVEPLTRGFIGLARNALPGVVALLDRARPVIDVLSDRLPDIGDAITEMLENISGDANSAAAGVDLILEGLAGIIRIGGDVVAFFVDMFRWLVNAADAAHSFTESVMGWNPLFSGRLEEGRQRLDHLTQILNGVHEASDDTAGGFDDLGRSAAETAEEVERLNTAFDELFAAEMGLDRATIAAKDGMKELKEELTEGRRTLNLNTAAGRENASAVLDQIDKFKSLRDARIEHGESIDSANAKYSKDIAGLRKTMLQAGFTAEEIDRLIGKYQAIPAKVNTTVDVKGAQSAVARANQVREALARIPSRKHIRISVSSPDGSVTGTSGGFTEFNRYGGVYEHAQTGLLREAAVVSPRSPARYAFAEPATGGEAFIPKRGDMGRSRAIWDYVGQKWLGMSSSAPRTTVVNVGGVRVEGASKSPHRIGREVVRQIEEMTARRADLMERTG
jgi:methyl-accepting chemotaxis protein